MRGRRADSWELTLQPKFLVEGNSRIGRGGGAASRFNCAQTANFSAAGGVYLERDCGKAEAIVEGLGSNFPASRNFCGS